MGYYQGKTSIKFLLLYRLQHYYIHTYNFEVSIKLPIHVSAGGITVVEQCTCIHRNKLQCFFNLLSWTKSHFRLHLGQLNIVVLGMHPYLRMEHYNFGPSFVRYWLKARCEYWFKCPCILISSFLTYAIFLFAGCLGSSDSSRIVSQIR